MATLDRKGSDSSVIDEKASGIVDDNEKGKLDYVPALPADVNIAEVGDVAEDVRAIDLGQDGKERPIDQAADYALRLVSLEDDPTLPVHTFRTWFLGLGLACFAAVLGELFVRILVQFWETASTYAITTVLPPPDRPGLRSLPPGHRPHSRPDPGARHSWSR